MRKAMILFTVWSVLFVLPACTLLKKPIDNRIGFSKQLRQTEVHIQQEDWNNALDSLNIAYKRWKKLKPILQIDIDHDIVNEIENNLAQLKGHIESKDKSNSLAKILLLQENWNDIPEM